MDVRRTTTRRAAAAVVAAGLLVGAAAPASAAGRPAPEASCLAVVFQAQAVAGPRTVSDRIAEIRDLFLGDTPFGTVLAPLAQTDDCG